MVRATDKVVAKAKAIVAAELEAAAEDIEVVNGKFSVKGSPDKGMALADVAGIAYVGAVPEGMEPGLEETTFYDPENFVFPFGAHACVVDVDAETGKVKVIRYVAVDDCGPAINPMLIDGQIHGGVVHGIGQALYERVHYDADGQLITGTFVDYALATAAELPELRDRSDRDPVAGQLARGQGRRRGRDDRGQRRGHQRRDRRAATAGRRLHQHAPEPDADLGRNIQQPGREPGGRPAAMIPAEFEYTAPESLQDAITALVDGGEDAKLLAGGHSLIPLMKLRLAAPSLLVDLRKVPGLHGVERQNGTWRIGALTSHAVLEHSPDLGVVSAVAASIADPQVRHRGTIGGSLAHGDSASDLPAAMLITEAEVTLQGPGGQRSVAAADLFQDYLTTAVNEDEVLTEIRLDALEGWGYGYHKFNRRSEDWAMVGVCAVVKASGGTCEDIRIGLTNMGSVPLRATAAEDALRGQELSDENIAQAAEQAAEGTRPPADLNATAEYKQHLARVLTRRAIKDALGAAG